jgi:hypothetical protein
VDARGSSAGDIVARDVAIHRVPVGTHGRRHRRIIDLLRRAAIDALAQKSKSVGIVHLLVAGANLPAIINQRADFSI